MRYDDQGQLLASRASVRQPTREQDAMIERIALAAGRMRVQPLAGGNVAVTVIIGVDGEAVETADPDA